MNSVKQWSDAARKWLHSDEYEAKWRAFNMRRIREQLVPPLPLLSQAVVPIWRLEYTFPSGGT